MDIYDTWKLYKVKLEQNITKFNSFNKEGDFDGMTKAKEGAKNVYIKFLDLLKLEGESDQKAFK